MARKYGVVILDFICFFWLLAGLVVFGIIGFFLPRPRKGMAYRAGEILKWTSNHAAPGSEKILDLEVARSLVEKYFSGGPAIDIAFGAGRFGEHALRPIIEKKGAIDGIDLELQQESSVEAMRRRPWVRNAWKRSYLSTGLPPDSYRFAFCNNGLMASDKIQEAFKEIWRITEDGGIFVFNMATNSARRHTYSLFILLNSMLLRSDKVRYWKEKAGSRIGCHFDSDELRQMLALSGWSVVETRGYLQGIYMYWHYLFNFPAYHRFFYYEVTGNAPRYYALMKKIWRRPLEKVALMHLTAASRAVNSGSAAKCYIVARKNPDPGLKKEAAVSFRPIRAFIDVSYACNLKCVMCDVYSHKAVMSYSNRPPEFMDKALFEKFIDQSAEFVQGYYLQLRGEPLMHPQYTNLVRYCRSRSPKGAIFFNTNGMLLTKEVTDEMVETGVNGIYVSIDAYSEDVYKKIRIGSDLNRVVENVEYLLRVRGRSPVKLDIGVSFVIQEANRHEQELFLKRWRDKVDHVIFYTKAELDRSRKTFFFEYQGKSRVCHAVNENIAMLVDGTITPCCADLSGEAEYGNLNGQSLLEILSSRKVHEFRAKVNAGDIADMSLCSKCSMWQANEDRSEVRDGMTVKISPFQTLYCCSAGGR